MSKKIVITDSKRVKIARFWKWVEKNESAIRQCLDISECEAVIDVFGKRVLGLSAMMAWELRMSREECLLIISVEGRRRLLPLVHEVVNSKPELPQWRVQALYQPAVDLSEFKDGTDEEDCYGEHEFKISDLFYSVDHYDMGRRRKMHATIYTPDHMYHWEDLSYIESVRCAVRHITGEMLLKHQLIITEVAQVPKDRSGLRPLYELGEKLEELRTLKRRAYWATRNLLKER